MSKSKKWAKHGEPETPVTIVARHTLAYRLKSVRRLAPLAAKQAAEDIEHVHRLRVGIRRASAALNLYAPLLSPKRTRKVKRQLRDLRRAAGPARDLDVLDERLRRTEAAVAANAVVSNGRSVKGLAGLRDLISTKRKKAQKRLKRACGEAKKTWCAKNGEKLVCSVKWKATGMEPDFRTFAESTFRQILGNFFAAGRADLDDVEALHQLRIEGKSVRYAMELLSPAFAGSFRKELYPIFARVQDMLGTINDHASAITFYRGLLESIDLKTPSALIESMIEIEITELESSRLEFLDWWTPERIEEMKEQFEAMIGTKEVENGNTIETNDESHQEDESQRAAS